MERSQILEVVESCIELGVNSEILEEVLPVLEEVETVAIRDNVSFQTALAGLKHQLISE